MTVGLFQGSIYLDVLLFQDLIAYLRTFCLGQSSVTQFPELQSKQGNKAMSGRVGCKV